jgi:hypothetical protein
VDLLSLDVYVGHRAGDDQSEEPVLSRDVDAVQGLFSKVNMTAVGLMEDFVRGAAVAVVAAKVNMAAVEVVGARVTVTAVACKVHL